MRRSWQALAVAALALAAVLAAALSAAVTRGPAFHRYADQRAWLGIPHAGDVLSNIPFILVGLVGLLRARRATHHAPLTVALFLAITGVGLGSGAYHLDPTDARLAFDWAPIVLTLSFLAALVISDRIDARAGTIAAVALPAIAIITVVVWYAGGGTGSATSAATDAPGDMRWYVITQATLVAVVALTSLIPPTPPAPATLHRGWILLGVAGFLAARGFAQNDHALLDAVGVSGHSAKHVLLGLAAACLVPSVHVKRG